MADEQDTRTAEELLAEQKRVEDLLLAGFQQPVERSFDIPVSSGRMYMGPALSQSQENAFMNAPTAPGMGFGLNLAPPPSGPPPTPPTRLQELQAADLPGFRTISYRTDVPMPVPEEPMAQRAAVISEMQRLGAAGLSQPDIIRRSGALALPGASKMFGLTPPVTPLQQARIDAENQRIEIAKKNAERLESRYISPAVLAQHKSLVKAEQDAAGGFDAERANKARWAREAYEKEHPELMGTPRTTGASVVTPPAGSVVSGGSQITTKAQFDALPKGSVYIGKDGKRYRKP